MRWLVRILFLFTLALLVACQTESIPPLVEVTDVSPREAEVGDRLEIRGAGFPQGRPTRVTFRGTLHRAGERARSAEIDLDGAVASMERIDVAFDDLAVERFCGHGDAATHTTFSGDVEVAFQSSAPSAPPLTGTLRSITLDVRPASVPPNVAEARAAEGARVLGFLGVTPGPATPRGLPLDAVLPGSPADHAGIQPGDVLTAIDGVRVAGVDDVLPSSARSARVSIRRGDSAEESRTIALVGYASGRVPIEYAPAFLLVAVALAVLLVLVAPGPASASAFEATIAMRLRGAKLASTAAALFGRGPRAFAALLTSLVAGTFALGPHVLAPELDGAILLVAALALLGAFRVAASSGVRRAIFAALEVGGCALLMAAAFAGAVLRVGAFSLAEIVRAQGGWPWECAALRDPGSLLLALAYLATLFVLVRARRDDATLFARPKAPSLSTPERVALVALAALGVALFFGGWQIPVIGSARSIPQLVLGALLFVVKTWVLVAAVIGAAALRSAWLGREARSFVFRRILVALAVGIALVLAARRFVPGAALETAFGVMVVAAAVLVVLRAVVRVRTALSRPEPQASPLL